MVRSLWIALLLFAAGVPMLVLPAHAPAAEPNFEAIFDGKSLDGWDGNPAFWRVEDGTITGQTTADNPTQGNTFLIWRKGEVADFELTLKFRIVGGNSGIQYRSRESEKWVIGGYQADIDAGGQYAGILYEERGRGILAMRGKRVVIAADGKLTEAGTTAAEADILASLQKEGWNDYRVRAVGNHLQQWINGHQTVDVTDNQAAKRAMSGLLALQLHAGPPMLVQFKEIMYRKLTPADDSIAAAAPAKKRVIFIAGKPSHGYGSHEHNAGCLLLAHYLKQNAPEIDAEVIPNGWPANGLAALEGADAVVVYCDGGGGHLLLPHLAEFDELMKRGTGLVCLHYAVEVPKEKGGTEFLNWLGGYFEMDWSVNPHWTAKFVSFPEHPISRGVQPFEINDEWYFHMRFRPEMKDVTPILSAVAPASTMTRADGPHEGNPAVRAAVQRGEPQHVAWAAERPDGGRGFGFTGGHVHWNWGDENFRKLVLNAIVWTAKGEVPANGVGGQTPTRAELEANQDEPKPNDAAANEAAKKKVAAGNAKPLYASPQVTKATPQHRVDIDVDVTGAKSLFLVVQDAGNGYSCDWADWIEPRLVGPGGEKKLTDLKWKAATSQWGNVAVNRNAGGDALRVAGQAVANGIGTHANSVIEFEVPVGFTRFKAQGGLDNGGTDQAGGDGSSVQFLVYNSRPPLNVDSGGAGPDRTPDTAIANLDVNPELEASLFAAEPQLLSPSNIDIDHRGRVWVCEIVNYRGHNGERPEGDRILILEDTNGDGQVDKETVFYQGRDIDSPHGVCVLGNQVIVSAGSQVICFTDENGDDVPDKKDIWFTGISGVQHDHGIHAFMFGPDGKLYFNFGNEGRQLKDAQGAPIVDLDGKEVREHRQPYQQGMVFRCNPDLSQFETLGWNFRNNWMVTVDSFGAIWQSDNDDDGNRGVRINYVMEFGNYGYKDEITGAAWNAERTNMETEIPLRHWHLNDPGVVPNLLLTGGGSPTGIAVYEGDALPEKFRGQLIHCDAGPSVTRAYLVKDQGAGYQAEIVNMLEGKRDPWFRPSDVKVAPDGSLIVADWYDPGVGGHGMGDVTRGRLFRVTQPGAGDRYIVPKFDFSTAAGAITALQNPNNSVRYLAWQALHRMGAAAENGLLELSRSDRAEFRARALWLLGKIPGRGQQTCEVAASDADPRLRSLAIRLARQLPDVEALTIAGRLVDDPSPQVRRECAIAVRHRHEPAAAQIWARLAAQYDGQDRWYLEALGIGADGQWDAFLDAWLIAVDQRWKTPGGRDIIWRSRGTATPDRLRESLEDPALPPDDVPRFLRALDFLTPGQRDAVCEALAFSDKLPADVRGSMIRGEAVARLNPEEMKNDPQRRQQIESVLELTRGTPRFVELVQRFKLTQRYPDVVQIARQHSADPLGIDATRMLLDESQWELIQAELGSTEEPRAQAMLAALGNSGHNRAVPLLDRIATDASNSSEMKRLAVKNMAKIRAGAELLLKQAAEKTLPAELLAAAASELHQAPWRDLKAKSLEVLPLAASKDNRPVPAIRDLVRAQGAAERGRHAFMNQGTCNKCHLVRGEGKQIGPDLTEIGSKLSREAMFESILYPSAGISHSYETFTAELADGNVVTGLKVSETDESLELKNSEGVVRRLARDQIETLVKQPISIMPADLHQSLTEQDLVDLVEYLTNLKTAQ